jgi:hypothetical protein
MTKTTAGRLVIAGLLAAGLFVGVAAPASAAEPRSISEQLIELTTVHPTGDGIGELDLGDTYAHEHWEPDPIVPGSISSQL